MFYFLNFLEVKGNDSDFVNLRYGNRLMGTNQINGLSYEPNSSAPFALPATQVDRLSKRQGFRIAYRGEF